MTWRAISARPYLGVNLRGGCPTRNVVEVVVSEPFVGVRGRSLRITLKRRGGRPARNAVDVVVREQFTHGA